MPAEEGVLPWKEAASVAMLLWTAAMSARLRHEVGVFLGVSGREPCPLATGTWMGEEVEGQVGGKLGSRHGVGTVLWLLWSWSVERGAESVGTCMEGTMHPRGVHLHLHLQSPSRPDWTGLDGKSRAPHGTAPASVCQLGRHTFQSFFSVHTQKISVATKRSHCMQMCVVFSSGSNRALCSSQTRLQPQPGSDRRRGNQGVGKLKPPPHLPPSTAHSSPAPVVPPRSRTSRDACRETKPHGRGEAARATLPLPFPVHCLPRDAVVEAEVSPRFAITMRPDAHRRLCGRCAVPVLCRPEERGAAPSTHSLL